MLNDTLSFPCPSCKEIINDRMEQCRFCGAPVDKGIAQMLAETQAKVNQAYSDASYLSSLAVVTKFQRFMQRAAERMEALRVPLYVTAHDFDYISRLVPGGP